MIILAIDPGNRESAWLRLDNGQPTDFGKEDNEEVRRKLNALEFDCDHLAIEYMKPRGMPTSKEEMDTQFWAGRFVEAWGGEWSPIHRHTVKIQLCNSSRAKDPNIRQALIDRFGGDTVAIGAKKCSGCGGKGWKGRGRPTCTRCNGSKWDHPPGPLYGISHDVWSALSIAVTFRETMAHKFEPAGVFS